MIDVGEELLRALAERAGASIDIVGGGGTPWMSATFAGVRHVLTLAMPAERIASFCDGIADAEFGLRGHIVADIVAEPVAGGVHIEALTIAEA